MSLEYATRKVQENQEELKLNGTQHFFVKTMMMTLIYDVKMDIVYKKTNNLVYSLVIKLFSSCMMTCREQKTRKIT